MADASPFIAAPTQTYSIKQEFAGATVLITGGSGYIGSLLIEQLLRTTDVRRIYVLIRGKKGCPAQERLQRLLHSGLFHLVREDKQLLHKVQLMEGDLNDEGLGLSAADMSRAQAEVDFVIHCAASIELEADVQHTLKCNYLGTRRLLELATNMSRLRCFLHVSTAYVNVNKPRGSSVEERIYPLKLGQQPLNHAEVVEDLLSLRPNDANVRAQMYLDMWDYPNTYTWGKHLTEQLVADYHKALCLPVAIVRPTLVCGLAGKPYPGYCGNLAGPIGMGVAMAIGLFDCLESVAMVPTHVWDAVPGDMVTSVVLAAAAATSARVQFNEYKDSQIGSSTDPMIVHAGTSTTYPISFAEASHAGTAFVARNPPPFKLPGGSLFTIPLDYRPDERAVERCKYWTGWKVWAAVKLLETLGQHKIARRLKYGHMAWAIQNSSKTDRHLFFGSKNLRALAANLDPADAESGDYTIIWTIKNGGWPRYIITNIAGMYRMVFGITNIKGYATDFKFIPNKSVTAEDIQAATDATAADQDQAISMGSAAKAASTASSAPDALDVVEEGLKRTASVYASIPASGSSYEGVAFKTWTYIPLATHQESGRLESFTSGGASKASLTATRSEKTLGNHTSANTNLHMAKSYAAGQTNNNTDVEVVRDTGVRFAGKTKDQ